MKDRPIKSVAIIGAGAAGAAAAAALTAENYFDKVRIIERREGAGGTWIYDGDPGPSLDLKPGALPPELDSPIKIPEQLPTSIPHLEQQRFHRTPIYDDLTSNVPSIAMSFSDLKFPYGPFVPHWIPRQHIESYFSLHNTDKYLVLNTSVEDLSWEKDNWKLILRKHDPVRKLDHWYTEYFDATIVANGHYSVPFVPQVQGLSEYLEKFPNRIQHSKQYRAPSSYANKRVVVVGNSASGHDVTMQLLRSGFTRKPVFQSRRSKSLWDGDGPPDNLVWKPVIIEYRKDGSIVFADGSVLKGIDVVIYCTGYKPSFPFWNATNNGRTLYDYSNDRLVNNYQHTLLRDIPRIAFVGLPRVLTFRSFNYQAIFIARWFSNRLAIPLPSIQDQWWWEKKRIDLVKREKKKFHQIEWDNEETIEWLTWFYQHAGLPTLDGKGLVPPVLDQETRWAIEHVRKYPTSDDSDDEQRIDKNELFKFDGWILAQKETDSLWFL